jgi:hypothetical protein
MAIAGYNATIRATSQPSIAFTDEATSTSDQLTYSITNTAKQFFDRDVSVVTQACYDELQTITVTGSPTGGNFVLRFGGQNTSTIAYNASASAVQTALQALSSIGSGNALVSGANGGPWTVDFTGTLGYASQSLITLQTNGLTGGSSPSVSITESKAGSTWTTITSGFTLYRVYARAVFTVAQASTTQVRFHSGNYYAIITIGNAANGEYAGKVATDDTTVFSTDGSEASIPTTFSGTFKFSTFHISSARVKSLKAYDLLILDVQDSGGDVHTGYCYATDSNIKLDPKKANREDLTFLLTDEFYSA